MRMWMIPPETMCGQHRRGEHGEIHKFRPDFEKGYSIAARRGQIEPESMKARHDELAAYMNHKSPYTMPDLSYLPDEDRYGTVDRYESLILLHSRCEKCAEQWRKAHGQETGLL